MAKSAKELSAKKVAALRKTPGRHPDGAIPGLYLQVRDGNCSWVFRYQRAGRDRTMGLGSLTDFSLKEARERARKARQLLADGRDPLETKRDEEASKEVMTFKEAAEQYIGGREAGWKNPKHRAQWRSTLKAYVFPAFGDVPVSDVDRDLVLKVIKPLWTTKPETASRVRGRIEKILGWAKANGKRSGDNPAAWKENLEVDLPGLSEVKEVTHQPALPYAQIPAFMAELRQRKGIAAQALEFLILTAARTGAVIGAQRDEIDFTQALWIVPPGRVGTKTKKTASNAIDHEWEAADFLDQLRPGGPWVLTAIVPDGPTATRTFTATDTETMRAFIRQQNAFKNIYYSVSPVRAHLNKKATKKDIASVDYLHVDADPRADETPAQFKARLAPQIASFGQQPTFVIDSGNGVQLLWRLEAPVPLNGQQVIDDIEARNFALAQAFGADPSTRNVDRILRVPGTTNWPNEKKRKASRTPCPATVMSYRDVSYPLSAFPPAAVETKKPRKPKTDMPLRETGKKLPYKMRLMLDASGDKPAGHQSRSELLFAFLCEGFRNGYDEYDMIAMCLDEAYRGKSIIEHISENGGRKYLEAQIEKALNRDRDASGKFLIRSTSCNLDQTWRQTQNALIRSDCPVFVRGSSLVQPLWRFEKCADRNRDTLVASFVKYNVARMRDVVGHHAAAFLKPDQRHKEKWKAVDPPREVIEALLEAGQWDFPSVKGIVSSPTMRPDGSLLVDPGYDPATQLWYKPAGDINLPPIPERPTKAEAKAALARFTELLKGFPFTSDVDTSVALAAILTTVLRGAFEIAPMFFISAPEAGTGKTYLVKVISTIATGREAVPLAGTRNTEEMEKRLSAAAFEASPILSLNNLDHDLDSGLLCQMLTEGKIKIRLFGRNDETRECDCRGTTVFANGNNIRIVGDLVRRTLTCRLDAKVEAPEKRKFTFDPMERIKAHRGAYLAAAFTIARAYTVAGSPPQDDAASINGFDEWRSFVQLPLLWLGQADPVKSMEEARAMDPNRSALADRMAALVDCIGAGKVFTAAEVHHKAMETTMAGGGFPKPAYPKLIEAYSRDGRTVSAKPIGNQLAKDLGRVSIGHKIELVKHDPKSSHRYRIVASEEPKGSECDPVVPGEEPDAARPTTPNEGVENDDLF